MNTKTITVKCWGEQRQITGKVFTIPGYEEISLIPENQYSGWLVFEVKTGLAVCPYKVFKTKTAAIQASLNNFTKYGKKRILELIESLPQINY